MIGKLGITLSCSGDSCFKCAAPLLTELRGYLNSDLCFDCDPNQFGDVSEWCGFECANCYALLREGNLAGRVAPVCGSCYHAGTWGKGEPFKCRLLQDNVRQFPARGNPFTY